MGGTPPRHGDPAQATPDAVDVPLAIIRWWVAPLPLVPIMGEF